MKPYTINQQALTHSDPFGMLLENRSKALTGENYRFGFNGYENTDEILGDNSAIDFGARMFDGRIGRFFSIDPKSFKYAWQSTYAFFSNNPILQVDVEGKGGPNNCDDSTIKGNENKRQAAKGVSNKPATVQHDGKVGVLTRQQNYDPLNYKNLVDNEDYRGLTTAEIRQQIKNAYPELEDWQVNITAGLALEIVMKYYLNLKKNYSSLGLEPPIIGKKVIPDFVHSTEGVNPQTGETVVFPEGGYIEVKTPTLNLNTTTSSGQLRRYAVHVRFANAIGGDKQTAGDRKAASLTIVTTYGTIISDDIEKVCTYNGVNYYESFAFINILTGYVVFSTPIKINNINSEMGTQSGWDNYYGVPLQPAIEAAIKRWGTKSTNETGEIP